MKKYLIAAAVAIAVIVGGAAYYYSTAGAVKTQLRIGGSTSLMPFMMKIAAYVGEEHRMTWKQLGEQVGVQGLPDEPVQLMVSDGGSSAGIKGLIEGTFDIAMASRPLKPEEVQQLSDPVMCPVVLSAIVPIVNGKTLGQLDDIDPKTLKDIYTGKIKYWDQVKPGLPHKKIVVIGRAKGSGTRATFDKYLNIQDYVKDAILCGSNSEVLEKVEKTPYAIGYVDYAYVVKAKKGGKIPGEVKPLKVNGIEANTQTIITKKYPMVRAEYLIIDRDNASKTVIALIKWIRKPDINKEFAEKVGYVPVPEDAPLFSKKPYIEIKPLVK
ncbi:phosphate ABC transporter substrate-binding protein [Methanopyrus sp. KOL6]|uniref:phosphate ABC transporter substrate-binding protein n=1 Tax=Methanopyrus sp. KOL6 TaxID=1937004 RepID=UPI0012F8F5FD|nr:phosphate ABC transporter substrate-binding protein [Methanopyrus sp. KOL6]